MENDQKENLNETKKDSTPKEKEESKKRFVSINDLIQKEIKIIEIFKKSLKKLI